MKDFCTFGTVQKEKGRTEKPLGEMHKKQPPEPNAQNQ